jgi:hypothetical protein
MTKYKLTASEKRQFKEMVSTFGGEGLVDKSKIKARILALRKRKSLKATARDMQDMFGY